MSDSPLPAIVLITGLFTAESARADEVDQKTLTWVQQIVLRGDFVKQDDHTGTRKWVKTPKLSVFGGSQEQQRTVSGVVESLNEVFKDTPIKRIELVKPDDATADIKLHLAARARLVDVAKDNHLPAELVAEIRKGQWPRFVSLMNNDKRELTSALIGLASDMAFANQFEHKIGSA